MSLKPEFTSPGTGGGRCHLLTQYLWPDSAPTGVLAEQLADRLRATGTDTVLVGGQGSYRSSDRPAPATPIVRLAHHQGRRGQLVSSAREFLGVSAAFRRYVQAEVAAGDTVVVTSAPPNSVGLAPDIQRRGARAIYWLQDYYPELLRTLWDYPAPLRRTFAKHWDKRLACWDKVVKAAENLGYDGPNVCVIRNWPTVDLALAAPTPRTWLALYSGNLGYCHHLPSFLAACEELRAAGYRVMVRGDGPGMKRLPSWIESGPTASCTQTLLAAYQQADTHLVAAHPNIRRAIFPSKFWNGRAAGGRIIGTGFVGEMVAELEASRRCDYRTHLNQWVHLVQSEKVLDVPRAMSEAWPLAA